MKLTTIVPQKIHSFESIQRQVASWRAPGKKVAFTNGVFDLLHAGHLQSISDAAAEADYLVVALNSDASVKRLKGPERPVVAEQDRLHLLAAHLLVDAVVLFDEDTPLQLIATLLPDVLVKGGDYTVDQIVGADLVLQHGGRVVINPIKEGYSTTGTIAKLKG